MAEPYSKPHRNFDEQLELLESRGLVVEDREAAIRYLSIVGYYTLGGYLYPMRVLDDAAGAPMRRDEFQPGASFNHLIDLYEFDRTLRLISLDALERIERAIKVHVAYHLGAVDPFAHTSGALHRPRYTRAYKGRESVHHQWLSNHHRKAGRPGHDAIQSFVEKYGLPMPIWVATDAMDFGDVSKLISHLKAPHQVTLAAAFGIDRGQDFVSWVRSICFVRNVAAHHDRLWNRHLVDAPARPDGVHAAFFPDLVGERQWSRTYHGLSVIAFFMARIEHGSDWAHRMGAHLDSLPVGCGVSYRALGAPDGWRDNPCWGLADRPRPGS
jgi:abortive infection bacteriophage resistance protein